METYRSGHNGADSKSVCGQPHVGSNPTVSAKKGHTLSEGVSFCKVDFERKPCQKKTSKAGNDFPIEICYTEHVIDYIKGVHHAIH